MSNRISVILFTEIFRKITYVVDRTDQQTPSMVFRTLENPRFSERCIGKQLCVQYSYFGQYQCALIDLLTLMEAYLICLFVLQSLRVLPNQAIRYLGHIPNVSLVQVFPVHEDLSYRSIAPFIFEKPSKLTLLLCK